MDITFAIPDDVAARLGSGTDLGRRAIEALALEEYRGGRVTQGDLQYLLGFSDRSDVESFLRNHGVDAMPVAAGETTSSVRPGPTDDVVERFRAFNADKTLGGLDVMELLREGRR